MLVFTVEDAEASRERRGLVEMLTFGCFIGPFSSALSLTGNRRNSHFRRKGDKLIETLEIFYEAKHCRNNGYPD